MADGEFAGPWHCTLSRQLGRVPLGRGRVQQQPLPPDPDPHVGLCYLASEFTQGRGTNVPFSQSVSSGCLATVGCNGSFLATAASTGTKPHRAGLPSY